MKLDKLTWGEKIGEHRHERALSRYRAVEAEWEKFREIAAKATGRPKEGLTITDVRASFQILFYCIDH